MSSLKERAQLTASRDNRRFLDVLCDNGRSWSVELPPKLKVYQPELEALLGKVFAGRARRPENFALAQQLSLNWCLSKCRQVGISLEESFSS